MKKINALKQLLISGSILTVLFMGSLPARAQTQKITSQAQEESQVQVSEVELQKFATALQKLQVIRQSSQAEIARAIQREGLSLERFKQISQVQRNPQVRQTIAVTQQERQQFELAIAKVSQIQNQTQSITLNAIQDAGLEVQRFNQILAAVQQNPELQQRVQQILRS